LGFSKMIDNVNDFLLHSAYPEIEINNHERFHGIIYNRLYH
jgi:hypothetical protein